MAGRRHIPSPLYVIDVAHPPRRPEDVEIELDRAVRYVLTSSTLRAVKVVHGYGSSGRGGSTMITVHNWAFRKRSRLKNIIHGEEYSKYHAGTQALFRESGLPDDPDLDVQNKGITILHVR